MQVYQRRACRGFERSKDVGGGCLAVGELSAKEVDTSGPIASGEASVSQLIEGVEEIIGQPWE